MNAVQVFAEGFSLFWSACCNSENAVFSWAIVVTVVVGIILKRTSKSPRVCAFLPSLAASIGIFGTFWGIFVGLSEFDSTNIQASVPPLLEGMKTAFCTSLAGMLGSIILKVFYHRMDDHKASKESPDKDASAEELLVAIKNQLELIQKSMSVDADGQLTGVFKKLQKDFEDLTTVSRANKDILRTIEKYMSGDENGREPTGISLQLKKSTEAIQDEFKNFSKEFSKMASESLVEQLKSVVDKFNATLSDLVAQSFKDLQQSTIELNQWQKEYKLMVETENQNMRELIDRITPLIEKYEEAKQSMMMFSEELLKIESTLQGITGSGEQLAQRGKELADQNKRLETSLLAILGMGEDAKKVIPEISDKMNRIMDEIKREQQSVRENSEKLINELVRSAEDISRKSYELQAQMDRSQKEAANFVEVAMAALDDNLDSTTKAIDRNITHISTKVDEWSKSFEDGLQKELTKSLNALGGSMVSISNQFATDYMPLANRLREIVQIAEKVDHRYGR